MAQSERRIAVQMQLEYAYRRHTDVFAGICEYAQTRPNWRIIIDEWADHTLPARGSQPPPFEGLIGRISDQGARRAKRLGLPVVNVWFNSPAVDQVAGVFPDYLVAGRMRAEHLLTRGFRSFGAVVHKSHRANDVQAAGFEQTIRQAGVDEFHAVAVHSLDRSIPGAFRIWRRDRVVLERWLDRLRLPIGLYVFEIHAAREIIEMCRNRGWRVPQDVAIVAGVNEGGMCERPEPSLSSLELPYEQVGREAARLLDQLIDENQNRCKRRRNAATAELRKPETILFPPVGVVARRSTDFHAVDDPLVRHALRYIDDNLHKQITIDSLAAALDVSRRTLTNHFRDHLQRSVVDEIQRLRLERVKRELTAAESPIAQIARNVGYGSPRTLNKAFQAEVGCTPREYRKQWTARKG